MSQTQDDFADYHDQILTKGDHRFSDYLDKLIPKEEQDRMETPEERARLDKLLEDAVNLKYVNVRKETEQLLIGQAIQGLRTFTAQMTKAFDCALSAMRVRLMHITTYSKHKVHKHPKNRKHRK